ncbi:MAG: radical SAM family heme chaperone HemW [Eubacteriales bacterium]|nr:radical SAM family heme chaperone HemW [Eubacteriales bacterium]
MKHEVSAPLEIYIHIPFCVKKCDYCDFLSGPADRSRQHAYGKALLLEIGGLEYEIGRQAVSVFFGGGTPSLIDAVLIEEILSNLKEKFSVSPGAEITIEANPGTLTKEKLEIYRRAGVNRLSLGLQSANNRELRMLGRIHTYEEFLESFALARKSGFSNINVDLMSAIPGQTREGWNGNLRTVAELGPEHISAYSLIVEDGTPFAERELDLPDEETEYGMYEDTAKILSEYGYHQYEISNYAKEGLECRHNIGYWRRTEYLGLGLGAASFYDGVRFSNTRNMEEYLAHSADPQKIRREIQRLSQQEAMEEFMFLGLRMTEGVREKDFADCFGLSLQQKYGRILEKYERTGFLEKVDGSWRFTRRGIHVSNTILAEFLE